jgi:tRNA(Ile2) C34 agmatinyltransferase TiaS
MLFFALLILAPAGIYALYRMVFYGYLPETCPRCGSRDVEYLGGNTWRCKKCAGL